MPDGLDPTPLDGVSSPAGGEIPGEVSPPPDRRRILLLVLGIGGAFLLFYLLFAFVLMAKIPAPDGGGQGLRLFGNLFYGAVSLLSVLLFLLLVLRALRSRQFGILLRPGIVLLLVLGIAGMVFLTINQKTPLTIDVLEPQNLQGLTAPVAVTFGTETLRSVLKQASLFPRKYKWDFNGDGTVDAEKQEQEVTTLYRKKGPYNVRLSILLSDGSVRTVVLHIVIPHAVFSVSPATPVRDEVVTFSAADLVDNPKTLDRILWDFNGDGQTDLESQEITVTHAYAEVGTYQVTATIQSKGGLQEIYVRPLAIVAELPQPFTVSIETEGPLKGTAPLGIIFSTAMQEGVAISSTRWTFTEGEGRGRKEEASGERVTHTFTAAGDYTVVVEVSDVSGRVARAMKRVTVLAPLELHDIVITGTPRPENDKVEGLAPLEIRLSAATNTPFVTFRFEQEHATRVYATEGEFHALYEEPGVYSVVLIAKDADERIEKFPIAISVLPPKSRVLFTAIPSTGIAPLTVTFDASQSSVPGSRITGFAWLFGDDGREEKPQLLGAQVTHRFETEGTYVVTVRALTEEGDSFEAKKTIVVRSPTLDACAFPSRTTGNAPLGVRFDASCSTGTVTEYTWDFGDGATAVQTLPQQDHVFASPGTYQVKLEIKDGLGNVSQTTLVITSH